MINKEIKSIAEAISGVESGMTFMFGGFGLSGIPENEIKAISNSGILSEIGILFNCNFLMLLVLVLMTKQYLAW